MSKFIITFRTHFRAICSSSSPFLTTLTSAMATEINAEDISSSTIDPLSVPSAEEINNNGSSTVIDDVVESLKKTEAEEFGFQRPEMFSLNISNTVDPYHRHMFLVYKNVENWEPIIEKADKDSLPGFLAAALKSHAEKTTIKTRMTICEGPYGTESSDGDVFLFPEMVKYRGLTSNDADKFVEDVLVNGKDWVSGTVERLEGSYVFVCSHGSRDKRCGVCGPELIEKFKEEIESRGMKDQVFVGPCSHVGGHKYAGNLIIFSCNSTGEVTGHWYGYATPEDVPAMLDQHIGKGDVIEKLWRGQMLAFPTEDSQKVAEEKLLENGGTAFANGTILEKGEKEESQASAEGGDMVKDAGSCCQGPNGVSCCKDGNVEDTTNVKKAAEGVKTSCQERLSAWMNGEFEQNEVYAGLAVVSAVATIAVAYSIYRRSG
ncbi:altered inheritance of mitochondria protein 32-like isoform X1 [Papaver somniferum]|uniref:altered inheritance of mitochondria protein 32-like isoform X1 n=1 Tax=Papaver somniferum TaxID=3469 RepID=UPI000E6F6FD7|nr:altered inheritance of mitochondria protein 32-like isoform X1 [Papaver somniferum]